MKTIIEHSNNRKPDVRGAYYGGLLIAVLISLLSLGLGIWGLGLGSCLAQNIGINVAGSTPNAKALLDIDAATMSPKGGLLIPRMTTTERNAITAPIPESLLIYNTTTQCFETWNQTTLTWVAFGCIGCIVPTVVTASAAPNPICVGSTLTLTGGATNATTWQWTGPNSYSSTLQSPTIAGITTAAAGVYTLTASNTCASAAPVSTASVSVSTAPTTAAAGTDITPACGVTTATLAGNTPTVGTGNWTVVSGTATITTPSSPTSGVTGLAVPGTATLRWTISNAPCADSFDDVVITTTACGPTCGTQVFAAANINVGTRINGAPAGQNMTAPGGNQKYCYNDIEANCTTYGGLYEWGEAMNYAASVNCDPCGGSGVQGICPAGYHIPTDLEWSRYEFCLESTIAPTGATTLATFQTTSGWRGTNTSAGPGAKMKVTSSDTPPWDGTNTSGFSGYPGGFRDATTGTFSSLGTGDHYIWSATDDGSTAARVIGLRQDNSYRFYNPNKFHGFGVRCLQN